MMINSSEFLILSFVGVIMFILLSGSFPFNGTGEKIYDVISTGNYTVCTVVFDAIFVISKHE